MTETFTPAEHADLVLYQVSSDQVSLGRSGSACISVGVLISQ